MCSSDLGGAPVALVHRLLSVVLSDADKWILT